MQQRFLLWQVIALDITSSFLDSIFAMVIILLVSGQPQSNLLLPVMSILMLLPPLFASLFGAIADNVKSRLHLIILSNIIRIGLFLVIAYLVKDQINTVLLLGILVLYIMINLFGQFENSLYVPIVPSLAAHDKLAATYLKVSALQSGVQVASPIIGATLLHLLSFSKLAICVALLELIIVFILMILRRQLSEKLRVYYHNQADNVQTVATNMRFGMKDILKHVQLRDLLLFIAISNGLGATLFLVISLLAANYPDFIIKDRAYTIAILISVSSAAILVGGMFLANYLSKISFKYINLIVYISWLTLFISAYYRQIYIFMLSSIVAGLFLAVLGSQFKATIVTTLDKALVSSYMGFIGSVLSFTPLVFTLILSALLYYLGDILDIIKFVLLPLSVVMCLLAIKYCFKTNS